MPYKIVKEKDQYCVQNTDTGENKGCSDTEDMAKQHMQAMYANEKKPGKKELIDTDAKVMRMLDQQETNYTPSTMKLGESCSKCMWWRGDSCHIVASYPEPITPNGYCDEYRVATPLTVQDVAPIPVTIVEPPMDMEDSAEMALPTTRRGLIETIKGVLKSLTEPEPEPAFSVFKVNGKKYWISRHTGKWKDREDEILANHSHDEYVTRVQSGKVPMPELWTWHKKGSRHGVGDMVWKSGGFTLAVGHFDDTPIAERAFQFYQKHRGKIKLSHMFHYPKRAKQGRVFHAYNTVEITTLPDGAEAFPYTSFEELDMSLTENQRAFIKELGGDEMLNRVEAADTKALVDTHKLEALGIESKGLDNFEGSVLPTDADIEALKAQTADIETKLKSIESVPGQLEAMGKMLKAQNDLIGQMQKVASDALAKSNDLEKKLLEYQAVAPPATQSKDTILNEREKSVIEQAMAQAKSENAPSLVEMAMGIRPVANP